MKRETLATGSLFGLSFLIASCCLGPALFIFFGVSIGALGRLTVLEPFRPYLIPLGALVLIYVGARIYRAPRVESGEACADGSCEPNARRLPLRWIYPIAALVYLAAVAFPYLVELFL